MQQNTINRPNFVDLLLLNDQELRYLIVEGVFSEPSDIVFIKNRQERVCVRVEYDKAVEVFQSKKPIVWEIKNKTATIEFLDGRNAILAKNIKNISYIT